MAYGHPPSYSEKCKYDLHFQYLLDAVEKALYSLGWVHQPVSHHQYMADIEKNLFSYGENLLVSVYDDGIVDAVSSCKNMHSGFDSGKNRKNVKKFYKQLNTELGIPDKEPVESRKKPRRRLKKIVLGRKTGEPEDGELIKR